MCKIHHDITVTNVRNHEVIRHEILLIKGFVSRICDANDIQVTRKTTSDTKSDGEQHVFRVSKQNGHFKVLLQLRPGLNEIFLTYCNKSVKIFCKFENCQLDYKIQPLYILCEGHNGDFITTNGEESADEVCKRITLGLKLVQCLYAEKLQEQELERKTFCLNTDCLVFHSKLQADKARLLSEDKLWDEFAKEIINSPLGDNENLKFVAFIGCTKYEPILDGDYSYDNIKRHTKAHAALGGGGLALFGSGTLYSWPSTFENIVSCFENNEKINLEKFQDESNYRRTLGGCFASTLGAVCHEVGHIFDLGHTQEGIMGNGFDYVNLVFTTTNRTIDLPNRIVECVENQLQDNRLTKIKQQGQFLQKHQQQKAGNDCTFFTKSCALILYFHKWFNCNSESTDTTISYDAKKSCLKSDNAYLKVIEVREKENGLVANYFDFLDEDINAFHLNEKIDFNKYNLFVITSDGSMKLFDQS